MKVVILCGGKGTRLAEETIVKPKPMVEVGGVPVLIHIMNMYAKYGYNDFVLALGHKADYIKDYFSSFFIKNSDYQIDLATGEIHYLKKFNVNWKVSLIDTGAESMTGGRLTFLKDHLSQDENFMLTYGDGVCDVNIKDLYEAHIKSGKLATVTAVRPTARFGEMSISNSQVTSFAEKPQTHVGWINGGFFVMNKKVLNYIEDAQTVLEKEPLERLTEEGQLNAFQHTGFWQCMDTLRDKNYLDSLIETNKAPWI
ncbi:MAG: glucose-1-phosphate cytidylyltransferase [Bacteriovorax sp.]|nr:glucose-1-phosphate cytidylyltransferase [Bacteriovorax sp.]